MTISVSLLGALEHIKLVPDENLADDHIYVSRLADIVEEGVCSHFGMREKDAIILRLARDFHDAFQLAKEADELKRKVKGLQLELGRVRKKLEG